MMTMMSSTPRSIHADRTRSVHPAYNLNRRRASTREARTTTTTTTSRTRGGGGDVRFRSCQPCFAFGGKRGQDPFAPTKQKVAPPTLLSSSLQEDEKSELPNCFEKKEKDSEDEKDKNDVIPNILRTPRERRRENEAEIPSGESEIRFVSLSELFPETGFSQIFHREACFRTAVRAAMREDLFKESALLSENQNKAIKSLNSSLMVPWGQIPKDSELSALTKLFKEYKISDLTVKNLSKR